MAIKQLIEKGEPVFFKNGVYATVPLEKVIEYDDDVEGSLDLAKEEMKLWWKQIDEACIYRNDGKNHRKIIILYGGRVEFKISYVSYNTVQGFLIIDGTEIKVVRDGLFVHPLSNSKIWYFLNVIETYGIDGFMEQYKEGIKAAFNSVNELIEKHHVLNSEVLTDEKLVVERQRTLQNLLQQLTSLMILVIQMGLHFKLGLENEQLRTISSAIANQFV